MCITYKLHTVELVGRNVKKMTMKVEYYHKHNFTLKIMIY